MPNAAEDVLGAPPAQGHRAARHGNDGRLAAKTCLM
jgi:hypothetical protein